MTRQRWVVLVIATLIIAASLVTWSLVQPLINIHPSLTNQGPAAKCTTPSKAVQAAGFAKLPHEISQQEDANFIVMTGTVHSGEAETSTFTVDTASSMRINLLWYGDHMALDPSPEDAEAYQKEIPTFTFDLCSPSGELVTEETVYQNGSLYHWMQWGPEYDVFNPEPGQWQAFLQVDKAIDKGIQFGIAGSFVGGVQINAQNEDKIWQTNQPLTFTVALSDTKPIANAVVTASIYPQYDRRTPTNTFSLHEVTPGIYSGSFIPTSEGFYYGDIYASGRDSQGNRFVRNKSTGLEVAGSANIGGDGTTSNQPGESQSGDRSTYQEQAIDDNGNGKFERLVISTTVNIKERGVYSLRAGLAPAGGEDISDAVQEYRLNPGQQQISLSYPAHDLGNTSGPYHISYLTFVHLRGYEEKVQANLNNVYTTKPYQASDWEVADPYEDQQVGATPSEHLDIAGSSENGWSGIAVDMPLTITHTSTYTITARLTAPRAPLGTDPVICFATLTGRNLTAGQGGYATLRFSGSAIRAKGIDGPYAVDQVTLTDNTGSSELQNGGNIMLETKNYFNDEFAP